MQQSQLLEFIANGENSQVKFKRDDCHPDDIAKEMSALLNLKGGHLLLGVEDGGSISGLNRSRQEAEQWIMNIARTSIQPAVTPIWTCITAKDGKLIGVIELSPHGPEKPYKAKTGREWVTYTRAGTTVRRASREEEGRLYQAAKLVRYELRPAPDMGLQDFDRMRLENYFAQILKRQPPHKEDEESWTRLLLNSDFLTKCCISKVR